MGGDIKSELADSLAEWAKIEQQQAEREDKDKKIISAYLAQNNGADILRTLELLKKYEYMPDHDIEVIKEFEEHFPKKLTTPILSRYLDVADIYSQYLESGGKNDD